MFQQEVKSSVKSKGMLPQTNGEVLWWITSSVYTGHGPKPQHCDKGDLMSFSGNRRMGEGTCGSQLHRQIT